MKTILCSLNLVLILFSSACERDDRPVGGSKQAAMKFMAEYATDMKWKVFASTCAGTDSDGDGYISCTANIQIRDREAVEKYLECASGGWATRTSGCKAKILQTSQPQAQQ